MLPGFLKGLRAEIALAATPLFRQTHRAGGESIRGAMEWALSGAPITAPLSAAGRAAGAATRSTLRGAISPIGRPLTGAVIGGAVGFATEDGSMEDRVVSGIMGAGIGLGGGLLSTRMGGRGVKRLGQHLLTATGGRAFGERYGLYSALGRMEGVGGPRRVAGAALRAGRETLGESGAMLPAVLRGTARAGSFALSHPRTTLFGAAGVVGAAYAMGDEEYRPAVLEQPERGIGAEEVGLPGGGTGTIVGPRNSSLARLQNSTAGLVQNLHAGRHRGR